MLGVQVVPDDSLPVPEGDPDRVRTRSPRHTKEGARLATPLRSTDHPAVCHLICRTFFIVTTGR